MSHTDSYLDNIPFEIFDQILGEIDRLSPPKDQDELRRQPYLESTKPVEQTYTSLKALSVISKKLRRLVLPRLFRHARLVIYPPEAHPEVPKFKLFQRMYKMSYLAQFLQKHHLETSVKTFTFKIVDGSGYYTIDSDATEQHISLEDAFIRKHWESFMANVPLIERLTMIAPPHILAAMASLPISPFLSEILHMPYQILSLGRKVQQHQEPIKFTPGGSTNQASILSALHWTSLLLNEGSFLRWYADHSHGWERELLSSPLVEDVPRFPIEFWKRLETFEYVAIVPVDESIAGLLNCLKLIETLQSFSFQTQPKGDMLQDMKQRGWVDYWLVIHSRILMYSLIYQELLVEPYNGRHLVNETAFGRLRKVSCLDSKDTKCREDWLQHTPELESLGWTRFTSDNGDFGAVRQAPKLHK